MPTTINELLTKAGSQFSTEIFDAKSIAAVEATLTEKNGKYFLKCRVRDKEVAAKPEEIIR
jgi:type I restriction enzyme M protein